MLKIYSLLLALLLTAGSCTKKELVGDLPILSVGELTPLMEGDDNLNVELNFLLDTPALQNVSFELSTESYTAFENEDFVPLGKELLTISAGNNQIDYTLTILGDREPEETEEFFITITNPNGVSLKQSSFSIQILDDDVDSSVLIIPEEGYSTPDNYPDMSLIWQDEFINSEINESYWDFEIGNGTNGWGNNELEYYKKENTYVAEGNLIIEARKENFGGRNYTSSRLITKDKFDFKYGRVDIRAVLPYGQGIWPALWMLGANFSSIGWPACGEIDIVELVGGGSKDSQVHGTAHWMGEGKLASYGSSYTLSSGIFNDAFHVFTIEWDEKSIIWKVDDVTYHTIDITPDELSEFRNNFFIILNVAVGGNWPGYPNASTSFPQRMIIDYIRVFQNN